MKSYTTTGEVESRMIFADDMEIAFSPDEDQAVFMSELFIIILYRDNGVSFDFWLRKDVQIGKVAFQTYNDLVVCAPFHVITQVSNLDFKVRKCSGMFLASNGSTVVLVPLLHVIYGITTLPGFVLSALTIKCIFPDLTRIPYLNTHPTENSLHVSLPKDFYVRV